MARTKEKLRLAAIAAKLHQEGVPQTTISKILGRRPTEISRELLPLAKDRGYVVTTYDEAQVKKDHLDVDEIAAAAYNYQRLYELPSLSVTVAYSGEGASPDPDVWRSRTPGEWDRRLKLFGRNAARHLTDILQKSTWVGVAWGRTLASVIAELGNSPHSPILKSNGKIRRLAFVPTCGEPSRAEGDQTGSSNLAARLNLLVNGAESEYSLKGVPALLHRKFCNEHRDVVRRALRLNPNYAQIMGGEDPKEIPLVKHLDTILTSVANLNQPAKMFGKDILEAAGVTKTEQRRLIAGDMGGVLVPKPGADAALFQDIVSLWTGITLEDYKRTAQLARESGKPGVVVFAMGGNKADILLHLLKDRPVAADCISHLILDHELATILEKRL